MAKASAKKPTVTLDRRNATRGLFAYLAVFTWIGWISFYFFFLFLVGPLLYIYNQHTVLYAIIGLISVSAVLPINRKMQPKFLMRFGEVVMHYAADYFKIKVVVEDVDALKSSGTALFALEPHDVLPLSIFVFNDCLGAIPGHNCMGCLTGTCFSIPLMRHVYTWMNATSVDKQNLINIMKRGVSAVLCPGGVQEVVLMENPNECVLYLKSRFGFVKLAMQEGVALVPCFAFGLSKSFYSLIPKQKIMQQLGRKLGFLPMVFFGAFNIPFGPGKPVDYTVVIGEPIKVPKSANPSEEEIKKYHAQFLEKMTELYEKNKAKYDMGHVTLRYA